MSIREAREAEETPSVRRIPASGIHVAIQLEHGGEHSLWSDLTLDVSGNGGVFVATFHPLPIGSVVHLLLTLAMSEGDIAIAATGVVRWTRPHRDGSDGVAGVGIAFTNIDAKSAALVERFAIEVREPMLFEMDDRTSQAATTKR